MRMSCNGCRVLRKGCSETCSIRPCLQWIKSSESQAHATVFLAKFYGRAGLLNLLNSGPHNLRPLIFRSLLYEACGRIVNPVHGSVGLLGTGNWQLCQDAVEAVLRGSPITTLTPSSSSSSSGQSPFLPPNPYDIRHVVKPDDDKSMDRIGPKPGRFKRSGAGVIKPKAVRARAVAVEVEVVDEKRSHRSTSRESSMTHQTFEESLEEAREVASEDEGGGELELELCLGFRPAVAAVKGEVGMGFD